VGTPRIHHPQEGSVLGLCSGAVAGLVVVTPACGFIDTTSAMWVGLLAGAVPFFAVTKLKAMIGYDDALDTFGVHAVGGTLGAILTGMLARNSANANLATNLKSFVTDSLFQPLLIEQIKAVALTLGLSVVATVVLAFVVKAVVGLRPTEEVEEQGLDLAEHGEEAYHG
jgi:Amt family ammonium transporter